jgi:hypothetical protein
MLAFCDVCGSRLAMAQQSAHLVRRAHPKKRKKTGAGGDPAQSTAPELVLKAMLATLLDRPELRRSLALKLSELRNDPLLAQPSETKINMGLTPRLLEELATLQEVSHLTQSQVIRATLVAARLDPGVTRELRKLVVLTT